MAEPSAQSSRGATGEERAQRHRSDAAIPGRATASGAQQRLRAMRVIFAVLRLELYPLFDIRDGVLLRLFLFFMPQPRILLLIKCQQIFGKFFVGFSSNSF